jgi:hypothetical protein
MWSDTVGSASSWDIRRKALADHLLTLWAGALLGVR